MTKPSAARAHRDPDWFGDDADSFTFRPVHYLGSKLRILSAIEQAINRVDPSNGPVCDLFSGSATVSRYLSRHRRVMAADIQEYARVLAEAVLNGDSTRSIADTEKLLVADDHGIALRRAIAPLVLLENEVASEAKRGQIERLCEFLEAGNLAGLSSDEVHSASPIRIALRKARIAVEGLGRPSAHTVCVRHFGGLYFSYAQAAELDAITQVARESQSPVLLAAALSTASHLVNSIGKQFAQPVRPRDKSGEPKPHLVQKIVAERSLSARSIFMRFVRRYEFLVKTRRDHIAVKADFKDVLANPALQPSVVYADPPYTRDHYSRFYHVIETMALGDDPSITSSNLGGGNLQSRGGYRAGRHQSPFCIKSQAPTAFSALFEGVAALGVPLVLSYSGYDPSMEARPRVMALSAVVDLANHYFKNVATEYLQNFEYMKLNTLSLNKSGKGTTEILLICY